MKVKRVLIYEGDREWIKTTLNRSYVKEKRPAFFGSRNTITETEREEVKEDNDSEDSSISPI